MGKSAYIKTASFILFVVMILFAMISGIWSEGIGYAIISILGSCVICIIIYALGEIIEQLEISNENIYSTYRLLEKLMPEEEIKYAPPVPDIKKTSSGGWICKKCNAENESVSQYCKECGEYK